MVALPAACITASASSAAISPVDRVVIPAGQAPSQCQSYGRTSADQAQARRIYDREQLLLSALLLGRGERAARELYDQYLEHGTINPVAQPVNDERAKQQFATSSQTLDAYHQLGASLASAATDFRLMSSTDPVSGTFRAAATQHDASLIMKMGTQSIRRAAKYMAIDYTPRPGSRAAASVLLASTTPALIAGGTGSVISQRGTFLDTRQLTGRWVLDRAGVLGRVTLTLIGVRLAIHDSIDFCPGNLGTTTRPLLLALSRLERTPFGNDSGWVHPVLWTILVDLPDRSLTVINTDWRSTAGAPTATADPLRSRSVLRDRLRSLVSAVAHLLSP